MLEKLLVANRGEIACRIFRTARRLGVATAAVYSEADARAMHVEQADEAFLIGPAPAQESYLCIDRIIEAALRAKAQAVHPGYGFLSENPRFAERCVAAGLIFVGPPAAAMRAMGSKAEAKALMARAGAPVVPGYHGAAMDMGALRAAAERIGVPLLIKAASGGGGSVRRRSRSPRPFFAVVPLPTIRYKRLRQSRRTARPGEWARMPAASRFQGRKPGVACAVREIDHAATVAS